MTDIDRTPERLVMRSGSTTLTLDKTAGTALLARKVLMFSKKPVEAKLSEIADATVDAGIDRASGVEVCSMMVVLRSGAAWAVPAADRKDAEKAAQAVKDFVRG
jgi:hypothetical protein